MNRDLEERAKEALRIVEAVGIGNLPCFINEALQYGLSHNLINSEAVSHAQESYQKRTAVEALGIAASIGEDKLPSPMKKALEYGIRERLFTHE